MTTCDDCGVSIPEDRLLCSSCVDEWDAARDLVKLNLGSGTDYRDGWVNVDRSPRVRTDRDVNLDRIPWPFETSTASVILLDNVLEHLRNPEAALHEVHRVGVGGALIVIRVPHEAAPHASRPGHRTRWNASSLDPWLRSSRSSGTVLPAFRLDSVTIRHRHPFAYHQRKYLGREILAWGPGEVEYRLRNRTTWEGSQPRGSATSRDHVPEAFLRGEPP